MLSILRAKFGKTNTITLLLIVYLLVVATLMLAKNVSITPDRFFVFLLFGALIVGRAKSFLRDWTPFLALLLAYEMMRGFADNYFAVHVTDLIAVERFLFLGHIPTEILQSIFYVPGRIGWLEMGATVIYFLHFPLPLMAAFFLWLKDKQRFFKFVIALLFLSFTGFITFLFFPAAPPWYATQEGYLNTFKITNEAVNALGWDWNLSYYYSRLNPNPVAAMPSLHAAYPTLVFLALINYSKRVGLLFLPYPMLVWFSTFYLGEHYVIDALAGIAYAATAFFVVYYWKQISAWLFPKLSFVKRATGL